MTEENIFATVPSELHVIEYFNIVALGYTGNKSEAEN